MAAVFREEAGRVTAWLVRTLGDFSLAEDIVQDALVAALEPWSEECIPDQPRAWLQTVARRKAIDRIRRDIRFRDKLAELGLPIPQVPDNRLELIFMCCVLLADQDRSRWDEAAIGEAVRLLERAAALGRPGPYQLQAAIAACHAEAPSWEATDWPQILILYDLLLRRAPTPVARLNRAVALRYVLGPAAALSEVECLAEGLDEYHLFHAVRADLLAALERRFEAQAAQRRALELTRNPAEQSLLQRRLAADVC